MGLKWGQFENSLKLDLWASGVRFDLRAGAAILDG